MLKNVCMMMNFVVVFVFHILKVQVCETILTNFNSTKQRQQILPVYT